MCVPKSVCEYYRDPAIRRAVDDLVGRLDGNTTPEMNWGEARNYNKALLSAAQVRGDFEELLFEIWKKTFGQSEPDRLGRESFESNLYSPSTIWTDRELGRNYYRIGNPEEGGSGVTLGIKVEEGKLYLYGGCFDSDDRYAELDEVDGWCSRAEDNGFFLINQSVPIRELCENLQETLDRFVKEAQQLVEHLLAIGQQG